MARIARIISPTLLACLLLAAPSSAAAASRCDDATLIPDATNIDRVETATLCLLNDERRRRGRARLTSESQLTKAAQRFSASMVRHGFFDHVSPSGSTLNSRVRGGTRYLRGPVRRWSLGENIAWGSGELATAREIVDSWMHSSGHRRNILDRRFRHIGIGVVTGAPDDVRGQPAATYTTDFGYKR
ncbi:MAG: CAP domain-containing protein [Solirubrobacteraceae bacterium]